MLPGSDVSDLLMASHMKLPLLFRIVFGYCSLGSRLELSKSLRRRNIGQAFQFGETGLLHIARPDKRVDTRLRTKEGATWVWWSGSCRKFERGVVSEHASQPPAHLPHAWRPFGNLPEIDSRDLKHHTHLTFQKQ